jgi:PhzF family phenazine biosynthesis protein
MRRVRIWHVDAFTATPLEGNPAAVVDDDGISGATMQRIALNQKLSETVFLLPPDSNENHAKIRIFTPAAELPFAGHPTVAAAHILTSEGIAAQADGGALRIETGAGVIPVAIEGKPPRYTMTQAPPQFEPSPISREQVAAAIGLTPNDVADVARVSTGLWWNIAHIASMEAMLRVSPNLSLLMDIPFGVSIFAIGGVAGDADVHVRTFAPAAGVVEDPVTGSSNGCIGAYIARHALLKAGDDGSMSYVSAQGIEMGQPGRAFVGVTGSGAQMQVQVGGHAVTVLQGELLIGD